MSFIFTGIAINEKFERNRIDSFAFRFSCNSLKFDTKLTFEDSLNMDYEDEYLDFIFFKNSTLVFVPIDLAIKLKVGQASFDCETLFFSINEYSMVMWIYYYRNLKNIKILKESNTEVYKNIDNGLTIDYKDADDLIFKLINSICEKSFWDIENETPVYRYRLTNEAPKVTRNDIKWEKKYWKKRKKMLNQPTDTKKWWKF